MMTVNVPANIRLILYIVTTLGTPVVTYLVAKDYIGDAEIVLWGGWTTAIAAMAGFNTNTKSPPLPNNN